MNGSIALVTGASRGIGEAIAKRLASMGASVALAARSEGDLERVAAEIASAGGTARVFPADVADLEDLRALVTAVERDLGPVDVLVNNAGIEDVCDFEAMTFERIDEIVRVNVTGTLWLTRLVVPGMIERRRGHIVNISSLAGLAPVPHNAVYSATKHALVGISRSLRAELADHDVKVSVVCPGFVQGGMFLGWGRTPPSSVNWVSVDRVVDAVVTAIEKNRAEVVVTRGLGRVTDVAQAISPQFVLANMRRIGVTKFLREQARINAERRG